MPTNKPSKKTKSMKPLPPISEEAIRERAHELWRSHNPLEEEAIAQYLNEARLQLEQEQEQKQAARLRGWRWVASRLNHPEWIEAIGVVFIPFAVWWATQSYQVQKDKQDQAIRQQEAIKNYLNQLTAVYLDGKIKEDKDLQSVTRASTLALLKDPNLNGDGKGQVIGFLSELRLIAIERSYTAEITNERVKKRQNQPIISLVQANLAHANLRNAYLSGADLRNAELWGANLRNAELRNINLSGANLFYADLSESRITNADLRDASIGSANLFHADLRFAYIRTANLSGVNLNSANLSGANLSFANLNGANLGYAEFFGADLRNANLKDTNMSNVVLRGANLSFADLIDANLYGANLSYANLSYADLSYADLSYAKNWTEEQLAQAKFCKTKLPPGTNLNPDRDCKYLGLSEN